MKKFYLRIRQFFSDLGLVEQSQIVASTAVVVSMVTIVGIYVVSGRTLKWYEFISIVGVGIIGYASVFFSLKYGRQLEEQRRELLALNTIAEAVNQSVELKEVLRNALEKVRDLLHIEFGWIYVVENERLVLRNSIGTTVGIFDEATLTSQKQIDMLQHTTDQSGPIESQHFIPVVLEGLGIESWASTILRTKESVAGVLVVASRIPKAFSHRDVDLLVAFGNHISVALQNARLFERLRDSERRYADLYEHSPDMYHVVNEEGIIINCNTTEATTLGYEKNEMVGRSIFSFIPKEYIEEAFRHHRELFQVGVSVQGIEAQFVKKGGDRIDVSTNTSIIVGEDGNPILIRSVMRDITDKKRYEQQILQAQKIDSIGNLAGGIAHDFNNILSSILGPASMLKRKINVNHKLYDYVDVMEAAARRGAALTRQLLTFARRNHSETRQLDIHTVVQDTLSFFERSVDRRISVHTDFQAKNSVVLGDEGQMQQAVLNIFLNARDAMPEGGSLTIMTRDVVLSGTEVQMTPNMKPGNYLQMDISDTGIGIDGSILQQIFEPFFTTKEKGKGTGLGLSVSYGIIQTHGGSISVESTKDVGSCFHILIPQLGDRVTRQRTGKLQRLRHGKEHILLVDDEEAIIRTTSSLLHSLGYTVTTASTGQEAVQIYTTMRDEIDLIILDMNMPQGSGEEVLEALKEMHSHVHILISSGYADNIIPRDILRQMVDGFLPKPYRVEDLSIKVRQILDGRRFITLNDEK
jgi:two-component system cell cycle sensor histidine kinase/response regulator CckA